MTQDRTQLSPHPVSWILLDFLTLSCYLSAVLMYHLGAETIWDLSSRFFVSWVLGLGQNS